MGAYKKVYRGCKGTSGCARLPSTQFDRSANHCANNGKRVKGCTFSFDSGTEVTLKSGDVTSAFLQTDTSLEGEELTVCAPPELARMFGASPGDGEHYELFKHFTGWRMLPENGLKDVRELFWSMAGDK